MTIPAIDDPAGDVARSVARRAAYRRAAFFTGTWRARHARP